MPRRCEYRYKYFGGMAETCWDYDDEEPLPVEELIRVTQVVKDTGDVEGKFLLCPACFKNASSRMRKWELVQR